MDGLVPGVIIEVAWEGGSPATAERTRDHGRTSFDAIRVALRVSISRA